VKVLQLHTRYREPGGEDVVVAGEAELLRSAGHEVVAHHVTNPGGTAASAAKLATSAWSPAAAKQVKALVERERPDVAHVHNTWYALTPSVVAALDKAGVPVVVSLHNHRMLCVNADLLRDGLPCESCVGKVPWRGVVHRCYRDSAVSSAASALAITAHRAAGTWDRHVRLFLCLTEFARGLFVRGGLPADKLVVKPNFVPDPGPRELAPSASRTLLTVGRLEARKGVAPLLDAWTRLGPDHGMELVMIGDGPLRAELEARALPGVRILGRQSPDEVRRLMRSARALVFPSVLYEGQPMVTLEAFAAGLPVLASDLGGNGELVARVGKRWVVPPADRAAWAEALTGLARLSDFELDEAGAHGRRLYQAQFTPEAAVSALESAYAVAMGATPRARTG
jgi:glycosyltransferase involved in cell wall biosynthesis